MVTNPNQEVVTLTFVKDIKKCEVSMKILFSLADKHKSKIYFMSLNYMTGTKTFSTHTVTFVHQLHLHIEHAFDKCHILIINQLKFALSIMPLIGLRLMLAQPN